MNIRQIYFGQSTRGPFFWKAGQPGYFDQLQRVDTRNKRWPNVNRATNTNYANFLRFSPEPYKLEWQTVDGAKAFALAPDTDYDQLKIYFDTESEYEYLSPGKIIRRSASRVAIAPIEQHPATNYSASTVRARSELDIIWDTVITPLYGTPTPLVLANVGGLYKLKNTSGITIMLFAMTASGYASPVAVDGFAGIAPGATYGIDIFSNPVTTYPWSTVAIGGFVDSLGNYWSVADLILGGKIPYESSPVDVTTQVSDEAWAADTTKTLDGWGNGTDSVVYPSMGRYHSALFHKMEPFWQNRAGLSVFNFIPSPSERWPLFPTRRYRMGANPGTSDQGFTITAPNDKIPAAAAGSAYQTLLVVPMYNAKSITAKWRQSVTYLLANTVMALGYPDITADLHYASGIQYPLPVTATTAGGEGLISLSNGDAMPEFIAIQAGSDVAAQRAMIESLEVVIHRAETGA
jgi:hypothetical protein